jgi:8-oxo-dGTP diphosphatase / 2-hydroxy-dATP diphosphatase
MQEKILTLLFLRKGSQLLLAMKKRGFGEGRWNGVGGKVEDDETIEYAMAREAQEEIGITPILYEKVADILFDEFFKGQPALMHVHVFFATKWKGQPTESEEMKPAWFESKFLPYDTMWADDRYWLPTVLEGKKIKADFKMDEKDRILEHTIKEVSGF